MTPDAYIELLQAVDGVLGVQQLVGELHDLLVHCLLVSLHLPQLWEERQLVSSLKPANQEPEDAGGGPSFRSCGNQLPYWLQEVLRGTGFDPRPSAPDLC